MALKISGFQDRGKLFTLENAKGTRLTLTDIGASVVSLVFRGTDIALGWDDGEGYHRGDGSLGATVGRNCNRIAGAAFAIGSETFHLAKNDGENNLHSGPDGYGTRLWETAETTENAVTFFLDSPDGDQGFPGHLRLRATYRLSEDDEVCLAYRGETDRDTVVNITNHTYFNLNGHNSGSVHGHILRLYASRFAPAGPGLIPTGEIVPVEGTAFDFTDGHPIGRDIECPDPRLLMAGGYDHCFLIDGQGLRPAAELRGEKSGISLLVSTDLPAVQLYTANFLAGERGKNGAVYEKRGAVCLETQHVPNAVNCPVFPSPIVRAGERYAAQTVWKLKKD